MPIELPSSVGQAANRIVDVVLARRPAIELPMHEAKALLVQVEDFETEVKVLRGRLATAETRAAKLASELEEARSKLARQRLPKLRRKQTWEVFIVSDAGAHRVFIEVGLYPDGRPGEVFINTSKPGSDLRAFMSGFSICVSLLLQQGVKVDDIAHSLEKLSGGPSGRVEGYEAVSETSSIIDLVVRLLRHEFGSAEG